MPLEVFFILIFFIAAKLIFDEVQSLSKSIKVIFCIFASSINFIFTSIYLALYLDREFRDLIRVKIFASIAVSFLMLAFIVGTWKM